MPTCGPAWTPDPASILLSLIFADNLMKKKILRQTLWENYTNIKERKWILEHNKAIHATSSIPQGNNMIPLTSPINILYFCYFQGPYLPCPPCTVCYLTGSGTIQLVKNKKRKRHTPTRPPKTPPFLHKSSLTVQCGCLHRIALKQFFTSLRGKVSEGAWGEKKKPLQSNISSQWM